MKKQTTQRNALICGLFATAWLATTIAGINPDDAAPQPAATLPRSRDTEQSTVPASAQVATSFRMAPLATFAEVNLRPLFSRDRRPHTTTSPVTAPGTPIVLSGIIILPEGRYAMIRDGGSPTAVRVSEGQSIASGTLTRIMPDHIEIALTNDSQVIVKLFAPAVTTPGNDHVPRPSESPPGPRTRRPIAQSIPPGPAGGTFGDSIPPIDTPSRSG